ncbi:HD family hydrolase [Amorphus orientalis]|uniref:5'-deoxynucleotidase YfbR-like HD superfamily hydrolase n=1 Tax=Amorphus orientalis TaxID=649198 RepID=A0AAE3VLP2_9HYPH|nr:HD family hydrolase [Amorphus orientalis]MDQ0314342.1 5'-deoxynucleotidase YfbR-like HD superfamily hydrolase [Amorphus orientalis]
MVDVPGAPPRAWQRMLSGRRLDLLDPSPLDIEIEDIAHGLARVARWNGQTHGAHPYSVAQHSLLVDHVAGLIEPGLSAEARLSVLLHDAPEYVVGDLISPFKAVLGGNYKDIEHRLLAAIRLRYSLSAEPDADLTALTKQADRISARFEATRLAGFAEREARRYFGTLGRIKANDALETYLDPWPTEVAQSRFLERFATLDAARTGPAR